MIRLRFVHIVVFPILLYVAGCGGSSSSPNSSSGGGPTVHPVYMTQEKKFSPADLTIKRGDTVVWTNLMAGEHTTTSGTYPSADGLWDSGLIVLNETYSVVFDSAGVDIVGTIIYFCQRHGDRGMIGTVTIQP